jgi:hypothetical protein
MLLWPLRIHTNTKLKAVSLFRREFHPEKRIGRITKKRLVTIFILPPQNLKAEGTNHETHEAHETLSAPVMTRVDLTESPSGQAYLPSGQ